jgi:hypothetical protein
MGEGPDEQVVGPPDPGEVEMEPGQVDGDRSGTERNGNSGPVPPVSSNGDRAEADEPDVDVEEPQGAEHDEQAAREPRDVRVGDPEADPYRQRHGEVDRRRGEESTQATPVERAGVGQ